MNLDKAPELKEFFEKLPQALREAYNQYNINSSNEVIAHVFYPPSTRELFKADEEGKPLYVKFSSCPELFKANREINENFDKGFYYGCYKTKKGYKPYFIVCFPHDKQNEHIAVNIYRFIRDLMSDFGHRRGIFSS